MRDNTWRGGRIKKLVGTAKTVKTKCLKSNCEKEFLTRLDRNGRKIDHICDRCKFINSFLGEPEEPMTLRFG